MFQVLQISLCSVPWRMQESIWQTICAFGALKNNPRSPSADIIAPVLLEARWCDPKRHGSDVLRSRADTLHTGQIPGDIYARRYTPPLPTCFTNISVHKEYRIAFNVAGLWQVTLPLRLRPTQHPPNSKIITGRHWSRFSDFYENMLVAVQWFVLFLQKVTYFEVSHRTFP